MARLGNDVLLFGGWDGAVDLYNATPVGDTWIWSPAVGWNQVFPILSPGPALYAATAGLGEKVLLYGGFDLNWHQQSSTWETDGNNWAYRGDMNSDPASPRARALHAMAALGARIVMFGGVDDGTWDWDGVAWRHHTVSVSPPPRTAHAMATLGDRVILFGGRGLANPVFFADTWEWDGSSWTERHPEHHPAPRESHNMAAVGDRVVLFGGDDNEIDLNRPYHASDTTWEWDGEDWHHNPTPGPSPRSGSSMVTFGDSAILFGGVTDPYPNTGELMLHADMWRIE
jgi:N-acetylneuraminic acid mutarotase